MINRPHFFWMLLLLMTSIIILISCIFGFFLFLRVNKEPAIPSSDSFGKVETVDRNKLSGILEYFSKREQKVSEILSAPVPLVDPSL